MKPLVIGLKCHSMYKQISRIKSLSLKKKTLGTRMKRTSDEEERGRGRWPFSICESHATRSASQSKKRRGSFLLNKLINSTVPSNTRPK